MKTKLRISLFTALFIFSSLLAIPTQYQIDWQAANRHYFSVTTILPAHNGKELVLKLPAWRPGRYRIGNYSASLIGFSAVNQHQEKLPFSKSDKDTWVIKTSHKDQVTVTYNVYANTLDAGSSYLQENEAYINPVNLLMYRPGLEDKESTLQIKCPKGWKFACALPQDKDSTLQAKSYHQLVDSPILMGPEVDLLSFEAAGAQIKIAIQGEKNYDRQKLIDDFKAIVLTQSKIMGGLPIDHYLFLVHFIDHGFGHGVEHANSTSIVVGPADFDNARFYHRMIAIVSHEFFHLWNVKRIRPESLNPPDYSRENYTSLMWFFEGVTSYYDELTLVRAGLIDEDEFLQGIQRSINRHLRNYGRFVTSVSSSSWDSWNKTAEAPPFTEVSVYTKGKILGLLLDLEIRRLTNNQQSLDDVMLYLWQNYGKTGKGLPENGVLKAVEQISGHNFQLFFKKYVDGTEDLEIAATLNVAGLDFQKPNSEEYPAVYLGVRLDKESKIDRLYPDSPALEGGLDLQDRLIAIDNREVSAENLAKILSQYKPNDTIRVTAIRRKILREWTITLGQQPYHEGWIVKVGLSSDSTTAKTVYRDWLWINTP